MSGVYECEDGQVLVSLDDEGCIASQVAGVKVMFGCQDCQKSFANARDVVTHVKEGKCKQVAAVPKRPRGRPRKDAANAESGAERKLRAELGDWEPNIKTSLTPLTPVRRATRVSTGAMQRRSIVDIIEDVSARKGNVLAPATVTRLEPDYEYSGMPRPRGRPRKQLVEQQDLRQQKPDSHSEQIRVHTEQEMMTGLASDLSATDSSSHQEAADYQQQNSDPASQQGTATLDNSTVPKTADEAHPMDADSVAVVTAITRVEPCGDTQVQVQQYAEATDEASSKTVPSKTSQPSSSASSVLQRTLIEHAYQDVHSVQPSTVIVIKPAPVSVVPPVGESYEEHDEGDDIVEEGVEMSGDVASILREATELVNSPHMTGVQSEEDAGQASDDVDTPQDDQVMQPATMSTDLPNVQTSSPAAGASQTSMAAVTHQASPVTVSQANMSAQPTAVTSKPAVTSPPAVVTQQEGADQSAEADFNSAHAIVREMQESERVLHDQLQSKVAVAAQSGLDTRVRIFTGKPGRPRLSLPSAPRKRTSRHFKCSMCRQRFFYTQDELSLHESCHVKGDTSDTLENYRCVACPYTSTVWNRLLDHVVTHEEIRVKYKYSNFLKNIIGSFTCNICNKVFDRKNNMKSHIMKVHHKVEHTCKHCNKNLGPVDDKTYKRHVEKCEGTWLACNECSYRTRVSANLRKHMKVHVGKGFTCDVCNAVFPTRQRCEVHRAIHNTVRHKYICEHCSAEFISADAVHKHVVRVHAIVKELFQCNECKFLAKLESDLKKHVNIVHNKKHKCEHCPYQTNSLAAIQQHLEYHRPGRQFPCPYDNCYYRGSTGRHLANHVNQVHRSACKHQCPICHKFYKKKTHLARHLVTHTGDKPYSCLECGEQFVTHSTYYRHRHKTGHDAKREGIVSVPQNITIQYVSHGADLPLDGGEEASSDDFPTLETTETEDTTELTERPRYVMFDNGSGEKITYVVEVEGNDASTNFGDEALAQLLQSQFNYGGKQVSLLKPGEAQSVKLESTTSQSEDIIQVAADTEMMDTSEVLQEETVTMATEGASVKYEDPTNLTEEEMAYDAMEVSADELNTATVQLVMDDGTAVNFDSNAQEETVNYEDQTTVQADSEGFIHLQGVDGNEAVQLHQVQYEYPETDGSQIRIENVHGADTIHYQEVHPDGTVHLQDIQFSDMSQQMDAVATGDHQYQHQYETIVEIAAPGSDETDGSERHQYAIVMMPEQEPEAALSMLQLHSGVQ